MKRAKTGGRPSRDRPWRAKRVPPPGEIQRRCILAGLILLLCPLLGLAVPAALHVSEDNRSRIAGMTYVVTIIAVGCLLSLSRMPWEQKPAVPFSGGLWDQELDGQIKSHR